MHSWASLPFFPNLQLPVLCNLPAASLLDFFRGLEGIASTDGKASQYTKKKKSVQLHHDQATLQGRFQSLRLSLDNQAVAGFRLCRDQRLSCVFIFTWHYSPIFVTDMITHPSPFQYLQSKVHKSTGAHVNRCDLLQWSTHKMDNFCWEVMAVLAKAGTLLDL